MGCSQSWLAVRGKTPTVVCHALGLRVATSREDAAESVFEGAELPGGWYAVVAGRSGHPLLDEAAAQRLSVGCEIVAGDVEEHVMVSTAAGWRDGRKVWSVIHDAQQDIEHLDARGELPSAFAQIRDRQRAKQVARGGRNAEVDFIFSVPIDVARDLTGYRYDVDIPGVTFQTLAAARSSSSSWLGRLFGR